MSRNSLISQIAQKDFPKDYFVDLVITNSAIRGIIVSELLTNTNIMVYYHCYYVISAASERKPALFYDYWDEFAALLDHNNSYHRDIGLTLIANLAVIDQDNRLQPIWDNYLRHLDDKKFMTAQCCLGNLKKIIKSRTDLVDEVVAKLLNIEHTSSYPNKQKELLKSDVLEIFDEVYEINCNKEGIINFARNALKSTSPKTKKRAKQFIEKYCRG